MDLRGLWHFQISATRLRAGPRDCFYRRLNYSVALRPGANGRHAGSIKESALCRPKVFNVHTDVEYTARKFETLPRKSAIMALKAVAEVAEQVPADDFQALEEKVYRTIER